MVNKTGVWSSLRNPDGYSGEAFFLPPEKEDFFSLEMAAHL